MNDSRRRAQFLIKFCLLSALGAPNALAAIGAPSPPASIRVESEEAGLFKPPVEAPKSDMASTREALALSMGSRLDALRAQGPQGYRNLVATMFDVRAPMATRWKATTAVGRIGGDLSAPELERAYRRKEWFMRSAALLAMKNVDKPRALAWAKSLLSDRALVVRSAAVDALADLGDSSSAPALWSKLWSRENFNQGDSLWIRRRMVETLARLEGPGSEAKFMRVLADKDDALHGPAIDALERISKRRLGQPDASVAAKRDLWLKERRRL